MFKTLVFVFSLLYQAKSTCADENTTLLLVQILLRHGDRAPVRLYPTDPNNASFWDVGLGALTKLGKKQNYALGKTFRQMYENFTTSSPLEVHVMSSDYDRCMKSVKSNLASFYAPAPEWKIDEHLDWQPFAVRYLPLEKDKYLQVKTECPRATEELDKIKESPEGKRFMEEHQKMIQNLSYHSGQNMSDWITVSMFHDILLIEKKYNLTIPPWVDPYYEELQNFSSHCFYWSFKTPLLHRLRAGPLLEKILDNMRKKMAGLLPERKIEMYSTHDSKIAVVLLALNLFNFKKPPYCASILFELHETQKQEKVVRLLFFNSTEPETEKQVPHVLILDGCTEFCPFDYFVNYTDHLIPEDWEQECQL